MVTTASNGLGTVRKMPVRTVLVAIPGDNYPGFSALMRSNPRRRPIDLLIHSKTTDVQERAREAAEAIAELVQSWNFTSETGEAIPITPDEVYNLPDELLAALIDGYYAKVAEQATPAVSFTIAKETVTEPADGATIAA